ncbi:MAG: family 16 glycoside hydrolase [Nanoarchaeota archaeon]
MKRGIFFSIDSLIASAVIILAILLISNLYLAEQSRVNIDYASQDVVNVLSSITIGEVKNDYVQSLLESGKISRLNNTVIEQIGEFWAMNDNEVAKNLSRELLDDLIPKQFGISVVVDGEEEIYSRDVPITSSLVSSVKTISGITKDKPTRGISSRLLLRNIREKVVSDYLYYGGFEGQGTIKRFISLPEDSDIVSAGIELDTDQDFGLEINGNTCLGTFSPSNGTFVADFWDITSCKGFIIPGYNVTNNFTLEFLEDNLTSAFVGGGFIKVTYSTSEANKPFTNSTRYWFPGISGYTNIFSSFYTPGILNSLGVYLHYNFNATSNASIYLILGNYTVLQGNSGEVLVELGNQTLGQIINYRDFDKKNVPLRLGTGEGTGGAADVSLVTDLSGSMQTCEGNRKQYDIDASFCGGDLFYDNFNEGVDDGWTRESGSWTLSNDVYNQVAGGTGRSISGNNEWGDFNLRVSFKPNSNNPIGIYFRYINPSYYYRLEAAKNPPYSGFRLYRNSGSGDVQIAKDSTWSFTIGTWYTFYVSAIGDRITVDFDKGSGIKTIIDVIDEPSAPRQGMIGLYTNNHPGAAFDNIFVGLDQGFCASEGYCSSYSNNTISGILYDNVVLGDLGSICSSYTEVPNCGVGTTPYCYQASGTCSNGPINWNFANCGGQGVGYTISPCCSGNCCSGQQALCGASCWVDNYGGVRSFSDCNPVNVWDANSLTKCRAGCSRYSEYTLGTCAGNPSPTQTWCYGSDCLTKPTAANFGSTCATTNSLYITMNKTGQDRSLLKNDFEIDSAGWAPRVTDITVIRDVSTSSEGTWSIRLADATGGVVSAHIMEWNSYNTANISKIEFDYKCESGARWGWMYYSTANSWGCIKGSGNKTCGANYRYVGQFTPDIICDNTWRQASFNFNEKVFPETVSGGVNWGTIIYDGNADVSNANKKMWFDNVRIKFEDKSFVEKCKGTIPVLASSASATLTVCSGSCNDPSFTSCAVSYTKGPSVVNCIGSKADHCQCFPSEGSDPIPCYTYSTGFTGYRNHWRQCDGVYATGYWRQYYNYSYQTQTPGKYYDCSSILGQFSCRNKFWGTEFDDASWTLTSTPHQNWGCGYCSNFYRQNFTYPLSMNSASGKPVTGSQATPTFGPYSKITDQNVANYAYNYNPSGIGLQWIQADLGKPINITSIKLWHYYSWPNNAYINNSVAVSETGAFAGEETVLFNSEVDGRYVETAQGKEIKIPDGVTARYVRNWINGSNYTTFGKQYNIWNELQVFYLNDNLSNFRISIGSDDGVICYLNNKLVRYTSNARGYFKWNDNALSVGTSPVVNGTNVLTCQVATDWSGGFNAKLQSDAGQFVKEDSQWKSQQLTSFCSNDWAYSFGDGEERVTNRVYDPDSNTCEYGKSVNDCDGYYPKTLNRNLNVAAWSSRWDYDAYWNGLFPVAQYLAQFNYGQFYFNLSGYYTPTTPLPNPKIWTDSDIIIVDCDGNACQSLPADRRITRATIINALNNGKIVITNWNNFLDIRTALGNPPYSESLSYNLRSLYMPVGSGKLIGDQYSYLAYRWKVNLQYDHRVKSANLLNAVYPVWYKGTSVIPCQPNYCLPRSGIKSCSGCDFTRIKLAKKLDLLFADIVMQAKGSRIGLVGYGNSVCANYGMNTNKTEVKQNIANFTANCGATCISCGVKAAWLQLNSSLRNKYVLLMSDGEANTCLSGVCGPGAAYAEALDLAVDAFNESGIVFYTIGFGREAGADLLRQIANRTTGRFCIGNDSSTLTQCYLSFADELKFKSQSIGVSTNINAFLAQSRLDLFSDSYIEINYTPDSGDSEFGKISVSPPVQQLRNCTSSVNIFPEIKVTDAIITSYSSEHWTDYASANNVTSYNLSSYGTNYLSLGDPFSLNIPTVMLNTGINNITIGTGDGPTNSTGCSLNNSFIYSGLINLSVPYSPVSATAEGCDWTVEFNDNSVTNIMIPLNYSGAKTCMFTSSSLVFDENDAVDVSASKIFGLLDFDDDRKIDVKFDNNQIDIESNLITQIPSLWGPAIVEVRVWQ